MKETRIRMQALFWIYLVATALLLNGCAYERLFAPAPGGMPEEIYIQTPIRHQFRPRILICAFEAPRYALRMGIKASEQLYAELLKMDLPAEIVMDRRRYSDAGEQLIMAHHPGFIVTGEILYYLNGMISASSSVEEEIKIYGVSGRKIYTAAHANAVAAAAPRSPANLIFFQRQGEPAPLADTLMKKNAAKFARMIATMLDKPAGEATVAAQTDVNR